MYQKVITRLNFAHNLSTNDKNNKIMYANPKSEIIFL